MPDWAHLLRVYSVDLPWRSSVEQRSQADRLATRIAELAGIGELAIAGGNWNSYGRADAIIPAALDFASLYVRPSRTRYSPSNMTLTPNYDVHDVLASVGMEDAVTIPAPTPGRLTSQGTSVNGRIDRIYLTRGLIGAVGRYEQRKRGTGDLVGARLSHARIGHPIRPGRALLNAGDGPLVTITVPTG